MSSSKFYKLWLWTGTAWYEVPNFTGMSWTIGVSLIGKMKATVHTRDTTLQSLLAVPGVHYRITNRTGDSNGWAYYEAGGTAGNFVIQHGYITTPGGDSKTITATNPKPVSWDIEGVEIGEVLRRMSFDPTSGSSNSETYTFTNTATGVQQANGDIATLVYKVLIDNLNSATHGRASVTNVVTPGSIDGGGVDSTYGAYNVSPDQVTFEFKQEQAYQLILDMSNFGSSVSIHPYLVFIRAAKVATPSPGTGFTFIPMIDFVDPTTPFVSTPGSTVRYRRPAPSATGYQFGLITNDPTAGPDPSRIINEKADARSVTVTSEARRVKNSINVKYKGGEIGFSGIPSSIAAFGRKESTLYAPWITDSFTAGLYRARVSSTYSGMDNSLPQKPIGIDKIDVDLKSAAIYGSSGTAFNAVLGDGVSVVFKDGSHKTLTLTSYEYDQTMELLTATLGIPSHVSKGLYAGYHPDESRQRDMKLGWGTGTGTGAGNVTNLSGAINMVRLTTAVPAQATPSAQFTVSHGLNSAPACIQLTAQSASDDIVASIRSYTNTTVTYELRTMSGLNLPDLTLHILVLG